MVIKTVLGYSKVEEIPSPHLYFSQLSNNKSQVLTQVAEIPENVYVMASGIMSETTSAKDYIHELTITENSNSLLKLPIYFKLDRKSSQVKYVENYERVHLYNSLIKELFNTDDLKVMTKWLVYMLYYYEFYNTPTCEDMKAAVVSDIADIITCIITKEYTLYREYDTASAITSLRWAYQSERVLQLGQAPSNMNLRRSYV